MLIFTKLGLLSPNDALVKLTVLPLNKLTNVEGLGHQQKQRESKLFISSETSTKLWPDQLENLLTQHSHLEVEHGEGCKRKSLLSLLVCTGIKSSDSTSLSLLKELRRFKVLLNRICTGRLAPNTTAAAGTNSDVQTLQPYSCLSGT